MKEHKENGIEHHEHAKDEVALMNNQVWGCWLFKEFGFIVC